VCAVSHNSVPVPRHDKLGRLQQEGHMHKTEAIMEAVQISWHPVRSLLWTCFNSNRQNPEIFTAMLCVSEDISFGF